MSLRSIIDSTASNASMTHNSTVTNQYNGNDGDIIFGILVFVIIGCLFTALNRSQSNSDRNRLQTQYRQAVRFEAARGEGAIRPNIVFPEY